MVLGLQARKSTQKIKKCCGNQCSEQSKWCSDVEHHIIRMGLHFTLRGVSEKYNLKHQSNLSLVSLGYETIHRGCWQRNHTLNTTERSLYRKASKIRRDVCWLTTRLHTTIRQYPKQLAIGSRLKLNTRRLT